ncbi:hypothetical protein D3C73_1664100 [compost metagenome]
MAGMEASTITSLGMFRLVMPFTESTIAISGRSLYTSWMSWRISSCWEAGSTLILS